MKTLTRRSPVRSLTWLLPVGVFLWLLLLNLLTPYICDDYTYMYSFQTGERIESVLQIIPSMQRHSHTMNGRLISHGLEQFFMLFPPLVFDVVNALVFTLTLWLVSRLCAGERNAVLFGGVFCMIWLFTPDFGQVALWQVGAVNYFWSLTGCVLFFAPALIRFQSGRDILKGKLCWALFCVYGFFFGWYNEIASFVGLCMVICLVLLDVWMNRSKFQTWRLLPVVCGVLGYAVMLAAPAQSANKQAAALTLSVLLRRGLSYTLKFCGLCGPLLFLVAWLFWKGLKAKLPSKTLVLAGLFTLAGICANYMPIVATYYPRRCMCTSVLMLTMGCGFLMAPLMKEKGVRLVCGGLAALTVVAACWGLWDVADCHRQFRQREETITAYIERGELDVTANVVQPGTPYSAFWTLRDLSTEETETWPNHDMARYYGIDSIIGVSRENVEE